MQFKALAVSAITLASVALVACSDSTKPAGGRPVSLSFSTAPTAGATFSRSADVTPAPATDVAITSAKILVARMELQSVGASCTSENAAGDDDLQNEQECAELQVGPTIVTLPLTAGTIEVLGGSIPAGTYSALEAKIRPIRAQGDHGKASSAFLTANPTWEGKSVIVTGTYKGAPFTYEGTPRAEFETTFPNPIAIGAATDPVNLTVQVDVAKWFVDNSGAALDPTLPANQATIAQNIRQSFRAFRDNDHDGRDDDHRP
jgi:hypothetical protein